MVLFGEFDYYFLHVPKGFYLLQDFLFDDDGYKDYAKAKRLGINTYAKESPLLDS